MRTTATIRSRDPGRARQARAAFPAPHRRALAARRRSRGRLGFRCRAGARADRPRRHRARHRAEYRHGEPSGHRPAGGRCPARTRRPRRVRCHRPAPGAGRGQPRAVPHAGHPHRCPHHQHRGHRPVRAHARRGRDADPARRPGRRTGVVGRQRPPLPEPLAPPPAAVGGGGRRRRRRRAPPDTSTIRGWAGRMRPSGRCWPRRWACRCRSRRTSTRWPGPSCCWACATAPRRTVIDQPVRLCARNRRLRAVDRRAGALAGQRAGHHRRAAGPLGAAGRHRPAGVDGQRRGGADRGAQGADHPGRGPGLDDGGGGAGGPAGQRARAAPCWPSGRGYSARPWRCCATCSTPTTWSSAGRRSPSTPRA